ncbi:MAG: methionyl-tRNA formyltransferase [Bacteroidetes bacterium]|nr:methionyl-tRNA formyltransferase [Bacteroidota bacterium]
MGKNLRIVFFGTPDFAVASLEALVDGGYNVVGVVTATDKPAGRGHKIMYSAVKEYALKKNLRLLQPEKLKSQEFIEELQSLNADLQIVVAFRMMPKEVYSMPRLGTFNLHGSLLPKYRGAAPIHWAVINGEKETGITTFLLNDKIDEGEIIFQHKISISNEETTGELYERMMKEGGKLVIETVEAIARNSYTPIPQTNLDKKPCLAPKIYKETTYIPWHKNGAEIVNFIRGMCPFPCANTIFIGQKTALELSFKVYKAQFYQINHNKKIGLVEMNIKDGIRVFCKDGFVQLIDIQLSGKKRMLANDFLRGVKIEDIYQVIDKKN